MAKVIVADKLDRTDGAAKDFLQKINSPLPIVLVSWIDDFVLNEELLNLEPQKFILADFVEMGWDYDWEKGHNEENYFKKFDTDEWKKFYKWANATPFMVFKRELPINDMRLNSEVYKPIEYPCQNIIPPIVSEQEFNSRPLEVFFNWGYSNPSRPRLHGEIWVKSQDFGYIVCDNLYNLNSFLANENNPRKWVTVNTPHYARFPMEQVLPINGLSKLSICLWGAGRKCFRTTGESPLNSVMVLPEDNFAYNFEWKDGFNCIKIKDNANPIFEIEQATKRKNLYEIYKNGVATCQKYYLPNYITHIENVINEPLSDRN